MEGLDHTAMISTAEPFVPKKPVNLDILHLSFRHPPLAQEPFLREAESLEQTGRSPITRIDLGLEAAQAHGTEGRTKQGCKRLLHESLTPVGSA